VKWRYVKQPARALDRLLNHVRAPALMRVPLMFEQVYWRPRLGAIRRAGKRRTAVASYPRSGNTWLRYLVEAATGEPTGTIYQGSWDGGLGRVKDGVIIKTHLFDSHRYTHAILIVRNPFDAIDSYFQYQRQMWGREGLSWSGFVPKAVAYWQFHARHWLSARLQKVLVRFEDLRRDPAKELRVVLNWLGYQIPPDCVLAAVEKCRIDRLRKANPCVGKRFFRSGQTGSGIGHFSDEERLFVLSQVGDLMGQLGYDTQA